MKLNHIAQACLLLFICSFSYSQTLTWGNSFPIKKGERVDYIIGQDENGYYASMHSLLGFALGQINPYLNKNNLPHSILSFDTQLNLVHTVEMDLGKGEEKRKLHRVVMLDGKLLAFYSWVDLKQKTKTLFGREIDKKSLKFSGPEKEIYQIKFPDIKTTALTVAWKSAYAYISLGEFNINPEKNTSLIHIGVIPASDDRKSKKESKSKPKVVYLTVDNTLKNIKILPEKKEEDQDEVLVILDELENAPNGHAYYFTSDRSNFEQDKDKDEKPAFTYSLYVRDEPDSEIRKIKVDISTGSRRLRGVKMSMNKDHILICTGYFKQKRWGNSIGGTFYMKIDLKSQKVLVEKLEDLSMEFLLDGLTDKQKSKAIKRKAKGEYIELEHMGNTEEYLFERDNGGYIMVTEQTVFEFRDHSSNFRGISSQSYDDVTGIVWGVNTTAATYRTGNIYVFYLNADGSIEKELTIPKQQYYAGPNVKYRSFAVLRNGDELQFFFTDTADNLELKNNDPKVLVAMAKGSLLSVNIDNEGNQSRKSFSSFKKSGVNMRPLSFITNSEKKGGVFLASSHKEEVRLGKIEF